MMGTTEDCLAFNDHSVEATAIMSLELKAAGIFECVVNQN